MYDYRARRYDPTLARFIQPDTLVPNPGDPQSLNRYSYAGNNPLRYVDPSGHWYGPDDYDEAGIENTEEAIAWGIQYYLMSCSGSVGCNVALIENVPLIEQPTLDSCGEASATMSLNYIGIDVDAIEVVNYATENGLYTPGIDPYTSPDAMEKILSHYTNVYRGHAKNNEREDSALLRALLDLDIPVIVDVTVTVRKKGRTAAHFVVVTALDVDNTITFNDPYSDGLGQRGAATRQKSWDDFSWAWFNNSDGQYGGHGWFAGIYP